jgi:hypothetical protein
VSFTDVPEEEVFFAVDFAAGFLAVVFLATVVFFVVVLFAVAIA